MVVVIDGAALLRDLAADFREFFLLFFLLLLFLLVGIGSLGRPPISILFICSMAFITRWERGRIREEGSDFRHGYSWAEEIISA